MWVDEDTTLTPSLRGSWNCPPAMRPRTWAQSSQTRQPISLKVSWSSLSGGGNRKTDRPNWATLGLTSFSSLMVPSTSRFMSCSLNG